MQEDKCKSCESTFNYYDKVATIVCSKNHIICKRCAQELDKYQINCPQCDIQTVSDNPYGYRESYQAKQSPHQIYAYEQNYLNSSHQANNVPPKHYQSNQPQLNQPIKNQPVVVHNNVPRHQVQQPRTIKTQRSGCLSKQSIFCLLSLLFLVGAGICFSIRQSMESCDYWGYKDCYEFQNQCCSYCPPISPLSYCTTLQDLQTQTRNFTFILVLNWIFGIFFFIFLILSCQARQRMRRARLNNNYRLV